MCKPLPRGTTWRARLDGDVGAQLPQSSARRYSNHPLRMRSSYNASSSTHLFFQLLFKVRSRFSALSCGRVTSLSSLDSCTECQGSAALIGSRPLALHCGRLAQRGGQDSRKMVQANSPGPKRHVGSARRTYPVSWAEQLTGKSLRIITAEYCACTILRSERGFVRAATYIVGFLLSRIEV